MLENDTNLQVFRYWYSLSVGRGISVLLALVLLILHVPVLFSGWWSLPCPHLHPYLHSELKVILQASLLFPPFLHFSISPFLHFHFLISVSHFYFLISFSSFPFPSFLIVSLPCDRIYYTMLQFWRGVYCKLGTISTHQLLASHRYKYLS